MGMFTLLSVLSSVVVLATGDYPCVCNHHTQRGIFGSPSLSSPPLGYLYKDECKAMVWQPNLNRQWAAVQFYHMIAYIQTDSEVNVIQCKGSIPDEDKASTMFPPPTTMQPAHIKTSVTSQHHTVTNPISIVQMSSKSTQQHAFSSSKTASITKPTSQTPKVALTTAKATHKPVSNHQTTMKPTTAPSLKGNTKLCPTNVQRRAHISGFLLAQFQHSCFEICNQPVSWYHANALCKGRGGHLASMNNHGENNYLHTFLTNHFHDKSFWIGLNDLHQEQHFMWSSGEHVSYSNWESRRNTHHHHLEDCVVMLKDGKWDDKDCGSHNSYTEYLHTRFPYVCEYGQATQYVFNIIPGIAVGAALIG